MDILGIGPSELVLVLLLALLIFGPEDLTAAGKKMGRFFNKLVKSETWVAIRTVTKELRDLPDRLARESELDELGKEIKDQTHIPSIDLESDPQPNHKKSSGTSDELKAWTSPPPADQKPAQEPKPSSDPADPNEDANENTPS
ncbi:twin-arginine translocase TatA/TatE family subunit [bacterium]|nr:twin-arginine translocase TatA/TatE family subunit [bacterium]